MKWKILMIQKKNYDKRKMGDNKETMEKFRRI